jgi:hypothetical protein
MCPWYHWPQELSKQALRTFSTLNQGIEFSPVLASWMFILAAVNLSYPGLLPVACKYAEKFMWAAFRFALPWLSFCYLWVPANQMLCSMFSYMDLPYYLGCQWLSFLSVVLAVLFLVSSLQYTGFTFTLHKNKFRGPISSGKDQLAKLADTASACDLRITRSGKVYGHYD